MKLYILRIYTLPNVSILRKWVPLILGTKTPGPGTTSQGSELRPHITIKQSLYSEQSARPMRRMCFPSDQDYLLSHLGSYSVPSPLLSPGRMRFALIEDKF